MTLKERAARTEHAVIRLLNTIGVIYAEFGFAITDCEKAGDKAGAMALRSLHTTVGRHYADAREDKEGLAEK